MDYLATRLTIDSEYSWNLGAVISLLELLCIILFKHSLFKMFKKTVYSKT